jgi:hypothetical protein
LVVMVVLVVVSVLNVAFSAGIPSFTTSFCWGWALIIHSCWKWLKQSNSICLLSVRSLRFWEEIGNHVSVRKFCMSDLFYNVAVVGGLFVVKKQYFRRQEQFSLSLNKRRQFG